MSDEVDPAAQAAQAAADAARLVEEAQVARAAADAAAAAKAAADRAGAETLAAQLADLERLRSELRGEQVQRRADARWEHLRALGVQHVTREQALALSPDVDVATADGRAAVAAWQASNPALFAHRVDPAAVLEQRIASVQTWEGSRQYPVSWQQETIRRLMGGK